MAGIGWLAAVSLGVLPAPVNAQDQPAIRFGAWTVRHFHDGGNDASRAALLTDSGYISVECRAPGPNTLIATWVPDGGGLGSPDGYTPRDISVQWDDADAVPQRWELFAGSAWQRDAVAARSFAEEAPHRSRLTLQTRDDQGRVRQGSFDLGPSADTARAMEQVIADCRDGWH